MEDRETDEIKNDILLQNVIRIHNLATLVLNSDSLLLGKDERIASEYRRIIDSCVQIRHHVKNG